MSDCVFCSIVLRKIKANIVAESEEALAFHDLNPMAPVHVLVIPKVHLRNVNEINEDNARAMSAMTLLAKEVASKLGVHQSGYRLVLNNEAQAGQSVFHVHMHVLGGRELAWPPG